MASLSDGRVQALQQILTKLHICSTTLVLCATHLSSNWRICVLMGGCFVVFILFWLLPYCSSQLTNVFPLYDGLNLLVAYNYFSTDVNTADNYFGA